MSAVSVQDFLKIRFENDFFFVLKIVIFHFIHSGKKVGMLEAMKEKILNSASLNLQENVVILEWCLKKGKFFINKCA